ncbi:hypothetical protein HDU93_001982 [Gonapodya sp. JEL0774]|nr:hypothetical protein HDU93_001982 [Gonapodya sp. JEL0774]
MSPSTCSKRTSTVRAASLGPQRRKPAPPVRASSYEPEDLSADDVASGEEEILPGSVAKRRIRNMLAARRSRERRKAHTEQLEAQVQALTLERDRAVKLIEKLEQELASTAAAASRKEAEDGNTRGKVKRRTTRLAAEPVGVVAQTESESDSKRRASWAGWPISVSNGLGGHGMGGLTSVGRPDGLDADVHMGYRDREETPDTGTDTDSTAIYMKIESSDVDAMHNQLPPYPPQRSQSTSAVGSPSSPPAPELRWRWSPNDLPPLPPNTNKPATPSHRASSICDLDTLESCSTTFSDGSRSCTESNEVDLNSLKIPQLSGLDSLIAAAALSSLDWGERLSTM